MTDFTDEAGTFTAGIAALGFLGERQDDLVIQSRAAVVSTEEHPEADDSGFEEEIFTRCLPGGAAIEHGKL